jgi:rhamnulokinase
VQVLGSRRGLELKFLAIDIGASGGKAIVGEFEREKLSVREVRRFPNGFIEVDGHKRWDIMRLFDEVVACIAAAPDADSVAIDAWGVDYGYIGAGGSVPEMPFAYRDNRTERSIPQVHGKIPFDRLYSISGIQHLPFNTIYQVADDLESRPEIVNSSKNLLMIPELLAYLLTGEPVAEYTSASTSGMLDARTRDWSPEILKAVGFSSGQLAGIVMPGELRVPLKKGITDITGSKASFVYTACHDTGSAVAGIPAAGNDWAYISSGTWSLVGMELDEPILNDKAREANFTNEGGAGGKIRFLKNVTGLWIIQELQRVWKEDGCDRSIETICTDAAKAPAFQSLINPDDPIFVAPFDMTVAIADFRTRTMQPIPEGMSGVARCVFESLALACRRVVSKLEDLTRQKIRRLHVVGGGSRNTLLCQMTADACNVPFIAGPAEATAVGNILIQAISHGVIKDLGQGRRLVADSFESQEYTPSGDPAWVDAAGRFETFFTG